MHLEYSKEYYTNSLKKVVMFVANGVTNDSRVLKTAQSIKKLGYDITVYGIGKQKYVAEISGFQFPIKLLPRPDTFARTIGADIAPSEFSQEHYVKYSALALAKELVKTKIDILHTHDMRGLAVGARLISQIDLPCKWVHDIHEYVLGLTEIHDDLRVFYESDERQNILLPDILTTVSPDLGKLLLDAYDLQVPPRSILNAPRMTDYDHHSPDIRSSLGLPKDSKIYVYCGNVKQVRGVDKIISALSYKNKDYLVILTNSENQYVQDLKAQVKNLNLTDNVIFMPYVSFNNVTSFLRTADIGIHPINPYPNAEIALPNKLFEFIHAGLPVISSEVSSMKNFIDLHDCGCSFLSYDISSLVAAIDKVNQRLISQPNWKNKIQELAFEFCWEKQEEKLRTIYRELSSAGAFVEFEIEKLEQKFSILQLPVSAAGQPQAIASGLRSLGHFVSVLSTSEHKFGYIYDFIFENLKNSKDNINNIKNLFSKYDVLHYHSIPLIWEKKFGVSTGYDLLLAKLLGKKVFYHFRGSESRKKTVFKEKNKYHYCDEEPHMFDKFPEARQSLYLKYVNSIADRTFVVDPELQTYVPDAMIVPRALDLEKCKGISVSHFKRESDSVIIAHAPSRRAVKGTSWVVEAVQELKLEGLNVDLRIIENMSNEDALSEYARSDIVVDQLRIGWYGVLAVEAMSLGKPVVAYIRDDLKHNLPFPYPLAIANKENLKAVLLELVSDAGLRTTLGTRARDYVNHVHSSNKIAEDLDFIYKNSKKTVIDFDSIFDWLYSPVDSNPAAAARKISYLYNFRYNWARLTNYVRRNGVKATIVRIFSKTKIYVMRAIRYR